jgi:6-pyruvoyltetrahydropterin/6-carboxytetrahydropterin synthase
MYFISVEKHFEAAHYIKGYHGKCENIHGHRYKVVIRVKVAELNDIGLAFDFTELKNILGTLTETYDHKCLNEVSPFLEINPTAENIAREIYYKLVSILENEKIIDSIEIWETPESCAVYRAD